MSSNKVWNLNFVAGNPEVFNRVRTNPASPMLRSKALEAAQHLADKGWRVWVEHHDTQERIFESEVEKAHSELH